MSVEQTTLTRRLAALVRAFPERRVLVVGDLVADQFLFGEISRVSREAPVLILRHERTETVPGGAANCAANLASLGARASIIGVVGEDEAGRTLLDKLSQAGVDCAGVIVSPTWKTTTKVRVLAGHAHSTRQQVIRVDYENAPLDDSAISAQILGQVNLATQSNDAFIISDYNYGIAGKAATAMMREMAAKRGKPVLVDSRFRLLEFPELTTATPNEDEVEQVLGKRFDSDGALAAAGEELRARLNYSSLLITRGRQGMLLIEEGARPVHLEAIGSHAAVDVTGAGDTVIATYTLALSSGASHADAARLANYAGGLVVMKRGTACVTSDELSASLIQHEEGA